MNAGILLRVNNPALGGAGDDPQLGTDYLQGYFVGFNSGQVVLGKHNYGWKSLASSSGSYQMNTWYHLKAKVAQDTIRVYVDDMLSPAITYIDTMPFINGRAGVRSYNTHVQYDNFRVYTGSVSSSKEQIFDNTENSVLIYPNPATNDVTIQSGAGDRLKEIELYNSLGELVYTTKTYTEKHSIPIGQFPPGIYLLRLNDRNQSSKKLIVQ